MKQGYQGVEPKIVMFPPQIINFYRVFHYFHHPFWGFSPYFWVDTHIGDEKLPSYIGTNNKPLLGSLLKSQDFMESKRFFLVLHLIVV